MTLGHGPMTTEPFGDAPRVAREPGRDELRRARRTRLARAVFITTIAGALAVALGFQAYTLYLIRSGQVQNRPTLDSAAAAAAAAKAGTQRIEDCTTPGGDCFERAQRQTSGAVAGINTITVRATACLAVVLKSIPDGTEVLVDDVAARIQQCIRSATAEVKPQRIVPAPRPPGQVSSPKAPATHPGASPHPSPFPRPTAPGSPGPTAAPTPTTLDPVTDLVCALAPLPLICP